MSQSRLCLDHRGKFETPAQCHNTVTADRLSRHLLVAECTKVTLHAAEYYSALKKRKTFPFVMTWLAQGVTLLSEISQAWKNKLHELTHR